MRTNSKQVRQQIVQHILDCVTDANEQPFNSIKEAMSEFDRVANYPYNMRAIPNEQIRFSDWLNGLPFGFLFYYRDVEDYLNGLGINPKGQVYADERIMHLYHYLIYSEVTKAKYPNK